MAFPLILRRVEEGHDVERVLVALCDVAKETMSAMVKLAITDEFPDIGQNAAAGEEAPRNAAVPVRIAELFPERWDIDAVWTPETDGSMRRLRKHMDFNDCLHDFLSESAGTDAIVRHLDIDAVCIHEIGVISIRIQLDSARHGFQRLRARGMGY